MSDDNNQPPPSFKPPERGSQHYKNLQREIVGRQPPVSRPDVSSNSVPTITAQAPTAVTPINTTMPMTTSNEAANNSRHRQLFDLNLNASIEEGQFMDDPNFLIDLAFKPLVSGLKLTPEQSQLILSHMSEILHELEIEAPDESVEAAPSNEENTPCK